MRCRMHMCLCLSCIVMLFWRTVFGRMFACLFFRCFVAWKMGLPPKFTCCILLIEIAFVLTFYVFGSPFFGGDPYDTCSWTVIFLLFPLECWCFAHSISTPPSGNAACLYFCQCSLSRISITDNFFAGWVFLRWWPPYGHQKHLITMFTIFYNFQMICN